MFEARLVQGMLLKQIVEAIKDLVQEANFDVNVNGIAMQAMDSSHVCLVSLEFRGDGFDFFRCDRNLSMGINMANFSKILKCAANDDIITLRADDGCDTLTLTFESPAQDRTSAFDLKLMSIASEQLGIPEQKYAAKVMLSSKEYQRICRDLCTIGDTVHIEATKDSIRFMTTGDVGTANIVLRHSLSAEKEEQCTKLEIHDPVGLTFALRYLNTFAKAQTLNEVVKLSLTKDLPIKVDYGIKATDREVGVMTFYLAPKIDDEDPMAEAEGEA